MASYDVKYYYYFDPIGAVASDPVYEVHILKKDYMGGSTEVIGSTIPVIHSWGTDDPKAPIKGSSVSLSIINKDGSLPLENFFSIDDDEYKVRVFWIVGGITLLMFEGFLVQDDCSETMVDFTHEINLSATDNLGLLKDVALDKAKIVYKTIGTINDMWSTTAAHTVTLPGGAFADAVQVGDRLHIHNIIFDVDYTVNDVTSNPDFIVDETVTTGTTGTSDDITLQRPNLFADKITILSVLNNCLAATGLKLNTRVFCNFLEVSHDFSKSFIEQTLLDSQTFLNEDGTYKDCYTILEYVMRRFRCTLMQARGLWYIVHWDELRYSGYPIPGYEYDTDFNLIGPVKLNNKSDVFAGFNKFQIGQGEDTVAETGLLHKILRPFQFAKETFNYKQPAQLLRNFDLQTVGTLLNTSTTGSGITLQTINKYAATWWAPSTLGVSVSGTYFIRVTLDNLGNEIERIMVVNGDTKSYKIEVAAGDAFKFSFSFKTEDSQPGNLNLVMIVELNDGITQNFYHEDGTWQTGVGFTYNIPSGDNSDSWHTVEIDTSAHPIPYDGLLYCYLRVADLSPTINETYYKDIRFEYIALINQSTKIIGQTHKSEQDATIKQNDDIEIFIDDSPRNAINGALFLDSTSGVLQDRTKAWFLNNGADQRRLGDLTTNEMLMWRRIVRSILEGTFYGLISADTLGDHVSILSVFNVAGFDDRDFIPGTMEIDYRNNKFSGTLWEMFDGTEVDADLEKTYEFKYLYSPK